MSENKQGININISNKAIDTIVDGAKSFLQSLIKPSLDEIGLLASDNIKLWRFKNQVKILNKAEQYVERKGLKTNIISLKNLVPLLEVSSLEEEESMQNRWAMLLANTAVNSGLNCGLFKHILSEIGTKEALILDLVVPASIQKSEDNSIKIFVNNSVRFSHNNLIEYFGSILLELDNLLRLGLIREVKTFDSSSDGHDTPCVVTTLGFSFYNAVTPL